MSKSFSDSLAVLSMVIMLLVAFFWQIDNPDVQRGHEIRIREIQKSTGAFRMDRFMKLLDTQGVKLGLYEQDFHEPDWNKYFKGSMLTSGSLETSRIAYLPWT